MIELQLRTENTAKVQAPQKGAPEPTPEPLLDDERWKRISNLLQSVLETPVEYQEEFLWKTCAGNADLLEEVLTLLSAHRNAGSFLNEPLINISKRFERFESSGVDSPTMTGQTISHYRVLSELASGGMGVVYQAEDINLGRRVAMKFLPADVVNDSAAFERLQLEARAASSLDHPSICSIYELGQHEGRPFIVMQLLEGQTLREWIENAADQDAPSRLSRVLDLAIQIGNGLEAAHQKGIVHRDIKPPNVFVTARGEARILDFGLAKLLENQSALQCIGDDPIACAAQTAEEPSRLRLTRTGTRMGTAYYMSPEQVREEELDIRTDLFSLGLVIYEMVTGRRGFTGEDAAAIHEATLHRELTPVRQLSPSIPAAMEQIIEKALRKDRNCRYQSARDMVRDLEALRDKLRPGTHWKSPRRLALVAAVFLAVAAGAGTLVERFWHVSSAQPAASVKSRRSVAVLGFRNLSGKTENEWISTALGEMVSTELASGEQLRIIPGENVARMKLDLSLPKTVGYGADTLKKIRRNLNTDVIVQGSYLLSSGNKLRIDLKIQDADAGETIASVSEEGSDAQIASLVTQAGTSLRRQLGIADVAIDAFDKNRATLPTDPQAARFYSEGVATIRIFDARAARDLFIRAIVIEPAHALTHSLLAESLAALGNDAQAQAEAKRAFELSSSLSRENQLLIEGRYRELSNDHAAALEVYRTLWKFFPDNLEYGLKVARAQNGAALPNDARLTARQLRQLPGAMATDPRIDLAEAIASASLGDFKHSQQLAATAVQKARLQGSPLLESEAREREGWAWDRLGQFDQALAADTEARDLARTGGNLGMVARDIDGMAGVLYDKGDLEGARKMFADALEVARQVGAQLIIATAYNDIGNVFYIQGKLADARRSYQQSLDIERVIGYKAGIAGSLGNLANVIQGMGDLRGATRMQEQALQAFRDNGDRRGESSTLTNIGFVLIDRGQLDAARTKLDESLSVIQQTGHQRGRIKALIALSDVLLSLDRLAEAHKTIVAAVSLSRELKSEFDLANGEAEQAIIELELGKNSEAVSLAHSSAEEFGKQKVAPAGCVANAFLSRALLAQGNLKEAQAASDLAAALYQQGPDRGAWFELTLASAAVKWKTGRPAEALALLEAAIKQASRDGYLGYELKAELLLGQIEISTGKVSSGKLRMKRLQAKSQAANFNLIAREAKTALDQIHEISQSAQH